MKQAVKRILDIADKTYYNWKNENRPIIALLEKYFTTEDLEEFLETGIMQKLESKNQMIDKIELYESLLEDHAFFTVKEKLKNLLYEKGAVEDLLKDVLNHINSNDDSYTLENSKQRFIDQLIRIEAGWLKQRNIKLASTLISDNISKLEAFAMVKNPQKVLNYLT